MEHDVDFIPECIVRSRYERGMVVVKACYTCSRSVVRSYLPSDKSCYGRSDNVMIVVRS